MTPGCRLNQLILPGMMMALALAAAGVTRADAAQAQSIGNSAAGPGKGNGPPLVWLRIMAFTDVPVVGADVRVSVRGSQGRPLVDALAATNKYGVFAVAVQSQPSLFRVSVSGGTTNGNPFFGHLSADIALTDPAHQVAVINPVTTLVSLLLDERPNLKLDDAEARVRSFLDLPPNHSLGMALRESSGYASRFFSPVALLTEAHDAGELDSFEHLLLQELLASPAATHSFRGQKLLGSTESFIAENLAAGVVQWGGGEGTGWVMQSTGLVIPGATSDNINALLQALADLQSSVDELSNEVAQLTQLVKSTATQTQYDVITTTAQQYATLVINHESDLQFWASYCPPLAEDAPPPTTVDPYCSDANKAIVISELQTEFENKYYEQLEGFVQDNGTLGTSGMLHLYSLWLGESKSFWRAADSTKMQNLYDYWNSTLIAAANLRMELFHYLDYQDPNSPAGYAALTGFMGDPTKSPATTGTFQANEAANLKLMFPALTSPNVVVSTVDHTMWSLAPYINFYTAGQPYPNASCWGTNVPYGYQEDAYIWLSPQPYAGFSNWKTVPQLSQWQAAVKLAPSSGTNWMSWLIGQTNTTSGESPASPGFFNALSCPSAVWTGTSAGGANFYAVDLGNNKDAAVATLRSTYNLNWPVRSLASGEQYYWYK